MPVLFHLVEEYILFVQVFKMEYFFKSSYRAYSIFTYSFMISYRFLASGALYTARGGCVQL